MNLKPLGKNFWSIRASCLSNFCQFGQYVFILSVLWLYLSPSPSPLSVSRQLGHVAKWLCYSGNWPDAPWHSGCWRCAWHCAWCVCFSSTQILFQNRPCREEDGGSHLLRRNEKQGEFTVVESGQDASASMRNLNPHGEKNISLASRFPCFVSLPNKQNVQQSNTHSDAHRDGIKAITSIQNKRHHVAQTPLTQTNIDIHIWFASFILFRI